MLIEEGAKVHCFNNYKKEGEYVEAKFVTFGVNYEEFDSGPGNYTTAVVMMPNGDLMSWPVDCVRVEIKEED